MRYDIIMWDFNGTLYDDVHAALASVNDMLIKRGMETITLAQYQSYIDTPIVKFYENIFDLNKITFDQIAKEFHEGYERHGDLRRIMPGALRLLDGFAARGALQTVCSSFEQSGVQTLIASLGIGRYFERIIGADDLNAGSKTERANRYIESLGTGKKVLFIGDSIHDYDTAAAIGADCALHCAGHQGRRELSSCGALLADDLDSLYEILFREESQC